MAGKPSFQFYPGDWVRDPISGCSLAAQGLWLRMMFLMHDAERYGYLTVNGSPVPPESIARRCGCTLEQYETLLDELERAGVPSRTSGGIIFSRRMVREVQDRAKAAERQARQRERGGGDPERWTAIRAPILVRDEFACAYCGRRASTVDHVIPKSRGGTEEDGNLVACCKKCNSVKGNRTPREAGMKFWKKFDTSLLSDAAHNVIVTPPSSSSSSFSKTVTGTGSAKNGTGPPPRKVWEPGTALERISDSERILLSRILDVCGDHENRAMYVGLIRKHSEGRVEMALSETKQAAALGKIKKTKGAYFVDVLKRLTPKTVGAA